MRLGSLALLLASSVFATSIVALRSPDNATIVADSSFTYFQNGKPVTSRHQCKLFKYGYTIFAAAGLATYEGFDVHVPAKAASERIVPLEQRVEGFTHN